MEKTKPISIGYESDCHISRPIVATTTGRRSALQGATFTGECPFNHEALLKVLNSPERREQRMERVLDAMRRSLGRPAFNTVTISTPQSVDTWAKPHMKTKPTKRRARKSSTIELCRNLGFEMSGLDKNYREVRGLPCSTVAKRTDRASWEIGKALRKKYGRHFAPGNESLLKLSAGKKLEDDDMDVFTDVHCAEWPSPVFTRWESARKFYQTTFRLMKKHGLKPQDPATVCGGNHLHFGFAEHEKDLVIKFYNYVQNLYFLPWVFTQPDDTDSCNNTAALNQYGAITDDTSCTEVITYRDVYIFAEGLVTATENKIEPVAFFKAVERKFDYRFATWAACLFGKTTPDINLGLLPNTKYMLATVNKVRRGFTLEYRCVEAPNDSREFADQVYFFNKLTSALPRLAEKFPRKCPKSFADHQKISSASAREDFYELCRKIGVSYPRYEKYVQRNLLPRWELGRNRY